MQLTICASETTPEAIETIDATWEELTATLSEFNITECIPCPGKKCEAKKGLGWLPAAFTRKYRTDVNVISVTLAVFDLDSLVLPDLEAALERVKAYRYIAHSTHSHDAPAACAARLVLPLSRPVTPHEWRTLFPALTHELVPSADPICKNPSRLFFAPSAPAGRETFFRTNDGKEIDVDAFLKAVMPPKREPEPMPNVVDPEAEPVALAGLRGVLLSIERTKARSKDSDTTKQANDKALSDMLARIRQGLPIAVAGDFKGDTELPKGRDHALNRAISCLAFNLPVGTPWEAVSEIMRETIFNMSEPEGIAHWVQECADMYRRATRRRDEADAQSARFEQMMKRISIRGLKSGNEAALAPTADDVEADSDDPEAWKAYLKPGAKGEGYASIGANAKLILTFAPDTRGSFRWNDVTKNIEIEGGIFAGTHRSVLESTVADWLTVTWGVQLNTSEVGNRILAVARGNTYDPVHDYLKTLVWDKTPRLDDWLLTYCKAATKNEDGEDITPLVQLIGARCIMSLAARGLNPGCKADDVMILEGGQGIRKSTALNILGGEWYVSDTLKLADKDSKMLASRAWLVELAELTSLKKGDLDAVKAFISTKVDVLRPPYAKAHEDFPRRCVFVGTVNPDGFGDYLTDRTGNRRFRPVRCEGQIDVDGLRNARDQLFAEAVARIESGQRWWFEANEDEELERKITSHRVAQFTSRAEDIRRWWHTLNPKPEHVMMSDVVRGAFPDQVGRISRGDEVMLGHALHEAGFKRARKMVNGRRGYYYEPKDVQPIETKKASTLVSIAGAKVK